MNSYGWFIVDALKKYHAVNGSLPNRIIVYRDGVGDGQLPVVVEHEVNQIIAGTLSLGKDYKWVLSITQLWVELLLSKTTVLLLLYLIFKYLASLCTASIKSILSLTLSC